MLDDGHVYTLKNEIVNKCIKIDVCMLLRFCLLQIEQFCFKRPFFDAFCRRELYQSMQFELITDIWTF